MMIRSVVLISMVLSLGVAQHRQRYQEIPEDVEPEPRFERPRQRGDTFNPATVHYVNIGTKLEGDYKFGYDTGRRGDGQSFREETRLPDGTVQGAYGYVDSEGRQRIVKYTAGKDGYKAEGDIGPHGLPKATAPAAAARPVQAQPAPAPQQYVPPMARQSYQQPPPQPRYQAPAQPQPRYQAPVQPQPQYQPPPQPQPQYQPPPQPQPQYQAPPQPQPRYQPQPQRQHRQQSYNPRPYRSEEIDYDNYDYNNEINERPVRVPVDTSLFNYNIGIGERSNS